MAPFQNLADPPFSSTTWLTDPVPGNLLSCGFDRALTLLVIGRVRRVQAAIDNWGAHVRDFDLKHHHPSPSALFFPPVASFSYKAHTRSPVQLTGRRQTPEELQYV